MTEKPVALPSQQELVVEDIKLDGTIVTMTPRQSAARLKRIRTIFRNVTACHHCDAPFPKSYLRWHAARAHRRKDRMSMLTCKKCGCWTPVQFNFESEAQPV